MWMTQSLALPLTSLLLASATPAAASRARLDPDRLATLLTRARGGDAGAFRSFVEETTPVVYRLALRTLADEHEAEDAVQETYVRAWQALDRVRDAQAALAWVCRVARNVAADRARARGRRARPAFGDEEQRWAERLASEAEDPHALLESAEARRFVRGVIDELPEKHRVVLWLREVDQLSTEETAAALGVAVGTVESRLSRARAALAKKVKARARRRP